jgi:iron(III) transport system ATP-binding protein
VASEIGEMKVLAADPLAASERVVISVRPEDIRLSEARPAVDNANVWEGTVDQKVFLGEAVDFQVKVRSRALQSRAHPSLRTPTGNAIWLSMDPEKCVALKAAAEWRPAE